MRAVRTMLGFGVLGAVLSAGCLAQQSHGLMTGMNAVNPLRASVADQNALIEQLKAAHVRVVRCGISDDAKGIDFAKRLNAAGIRIELIVTPQFAKDAPSVPYQPKAFPNMWGGHPLSYADPELSRTSFQSLLSQLDANRIELAALELGNEINWTAFNPEFPLPGKGRIFDYKDLSSDPEAKQVAKGYLQYLRVLAVLKEVRDRSTVNGRTPILSAGLSDPGPARVVPGGKEDAVTINATIQYLREHGLDKYVDGYGIHQYPWQTTPQARKTAILNNGLAACGTGAPGQPKPCWITEWGLDNASTSCPLNDKPRAAIAQETMGTFRDMAKSGRVAATIYFSWNSDPWAKQVSASSVYRCGAETETAKIALQP